MNKYKYAYTATLVVACLSTDLTMMAQDRSLSSHEQYLTVPANDLHEPMWPPAENELTDTDKGNVNNPALPSYAQGRGQETGGPARELIPN